MSPINSRRKGKVGELEWVGFLREQGYEARRTQQFNGAAEGGKHDVVSDDPVGNWEVKRAQALNLPLTVQRAMEEANGAGCAVAWRRNRERWIVAMDAEQFFNLVRVCRDSGKRERVE